MLRKFMTTLVLAVAATAAMAAGKVNINEASAESLAAGLDGVGPARADAIVAYREANGAFPSVAALVNVKGIGEATLTGNRDRMTVGAVE